MEVSSTCLLNAFTRLFDIDPLRRDILSVISARNQSDHGLLYVLFVLIFMYRFSFFELIGVYVLFKTSFIF